MSHPPDKPVPQEPEQLTCDVCLTDIPASVAETMEGPDYIHHFCGIECMKRWQEEKAKEQG